MQFFPMVNGSDRNDESNIQQRRIVQMNVFSDTRHFNSFVVRNNYTTIGAAGNTNIIGGPPIDIRTYLIHEKSVSFTFLLGGGLTSDLNATSQPSPAPTRPVPIDYGPPNDPGALPVDKITHFTAVPSWTIYQGGKSIPKHVGENANDQLCFPVDALTDLPATSRLTFQGMPIVNVSYVEIRGRISKHITQ
jgi:hypothetical protein